LVEPSSIRCFSEEEYIKSGCQICTDVQQGDIIIGIKEVPKEKVISSKVYLMFSHCIKGQTEGIELLKKMISSNATLIDYEKVTDVHGKRIIGFSLHAGYAGTLDSLWLLGKMLRKNGLKSSFENLVLSNNYNTLYQARIALKEINSINLLSKNFRNPIIIGILGDGNIAKGVKEILSDLSVIWIGVNEIKKVYQKGHSSKIYACIFRLSDLLENNQGFCREHFNEHPEEYKSKIGQYLKYLTIVINGLYWKEGNPHIITWDMLQDIYTDRKIMILADLANDVRGTFECNIKYTNLSNPYYYISPETQDIVNDNSNIVMLASENYPAELPVDASTYFSGLLLPYILDIASADFSDKFERVNLPREIKEAVIVYRGNLTHKYVYLKKYLN